MSRFGFWAALAVAGFILVFLELDGDPVKIRMAAVAAMMAILWLTEAVPLAATALLPLALFPLLGISSSAAVAGKYMNSTVFLLVGGFMIALAMQRWNLHKRIALSILSVFGEHPVRIMLGFVAATAGLSMWISNTAATLVMLPIATAIIGRIEADMSAEEARRFSVALLLSIAYSASIGGMMTLVGTAPNLVFARLYQVASEAPVGFTQWMLLGVPVGATMLAVAAVYLGGIVMRKLPASDLAGDVVAREMALLGRVRFEEKVVLTVFGITAALWITRSSLEIGTFRLPGWGDAFATGPLIDDGTVAVAMACVLFLIPARDADGRRTRILDEGVFVSLPWSVVLLFGGGFALASGFESSGLSAYIASHLDVLSGAPRTTMIASIASVMTFLTELTSNTATTQLVLPILQSAAEAMSISPLWLMLPATLSASCAFMFPVATPPNAIIFGSGRLHVIDMVKTGFLLNLAGIAVITLVITLLAPTVFGIAR